MNKFKKIEQFRQVIREVQQSARFVGLDENEEPIYNNAEMPTLRFYGSVKLHGTNASIGLDAEGNFFCQSRNNVITPEKDNAGFAAWAYKNVESLTSILKSFGEFEDHVIIYGEWVGQGIQKGTGISEIEKSFFTFRVKKDGEGLNYGIHAYPELKIYNLPVMYQVQIDVDFNNPQLVQNELIKLTEEVETECPIAKQLGVSGIGEGIVWATEDYKYVFKVKGEKFMVSKPTKRITGIEVGSSISQEIIRLMEKHKVTTCNYFFQ